MACVPQFARALCQVSARILRALAVSSLETLNTWFRTDIRKQSAAHVHVHVHVYVYVYVYVGLLEGSY